ncbi:MAG: hypothetical protein JNK87_10175 [Bryobacterales bacterium]|nr:hypothetical protein [Bryobacterales bacterium]
MKGELGLAGEFVVGGVIHGVKGMESGEEVGQGDGGLGGGFGAVAVDEDAGIAVLGANVWEGGADGVVGAERVAEEGEEAGDVIAGEGEGTGLKGFETEISDKGVLNDEGAKLL